MWLWNKNNSLYNYGNKTEVQCIQLYFQNAVPFHTFGNYERS